MSHVGASCNCPVMTQGHVAHLVGCSFAPRYTPPVTRMAEQRCPVCEGKGVVQWDPLAPFGGLSAHTGPFTCPHCDGRRIVFVMENL